MQTSRLTVVFMTSALAAMASASTLAQQVRAESQPVSGARAGQVLADPKTRRAELDDAIAALGELIDAPMPSGLTRAEQSNWKEQTAWLASVRGRYQRLSASYAAIGSSTGGGHSAAPLVPGGAVLSAGISNVGGTNDSNDSAKPPRASAGATAADRVKQLNAQLSAVQNAVEAESRRFQTLSNASKTRHDTAKSIIQNMRA